MKTFRIIYKTILTAIILVSCSDYLDVNDDPNNPLSVNPNLILPAAQSYSAFIQESFKSQNSLGNFIMYNWAESAGSAFYTPEFRYQVTPSFYSQIFDYTYSNVLKQYNDLYILEGDKYGYYRAISKIMMSYHFQILVDTYGDIPYSEALGRGDNPTPKYDNAETIYDDLVLQLTDAIETINSTSLNSEISPLLPGSDDIMFNGNMELWKKFANTIKLRILVRQSDMPGKTAYLLNEFAVIASEGSGYMETDVTIQPGYFNEQDKMNHKWAKFGQDTQGNNTVYNNATCATQYVIDYLTNTQDPRIDFIFEEPTNGHLGVIQGETDYDNPIVGQWLPENVSNMGTGILKGPDQPAIIMTLAEIYLNLSEAALKGLISGNAELFYEAGIQASFDYLSAGNGSSYYSNTINLVNWDTSSNKLEAIITQKWIALNCIDALQSWFDYSRTGYPANLPISALATTPDRPVRLAYPVSEITSNGENCPEQPDVFTEKIFWAN